MGRKRSGASLVLLVLIVSALVSFALGLDPNYLVNGGLDWDQDSNGVADGWNSEIHTAEGAFGFFAVDPKIRFCGTGAQKIVHLSEKGWVRISQDLISALPSARYLFRCWVLSECQSLLIAYSRDEQGRYRELWSLRLPPDASGTWKRYQGLFTTPPDCRWIKVSLVTETRGTAWFDDAQLIPLSPPPTVLSVQQSEPPVLDGRLTDPVWQRAEPLDLFLSLDDQALASPQTVAAIVHTPDCLYISFRCEEPAVSRLRLQSSRSGRPAYSDDCVEIYISSDPSQSIQLVVTPEGNTFSQRMTADPTTPHWWLLPSRSHTPWEGQWRCATLRGTDFWSAEVAVPFSQVPYLRNLPFIRVNLCRSRKAGGREENSAFAYLGAKTFQKPELFPFLRLVGPPDLRKETVRRRVPEFVVVPQSQRFVTSGRLIRCQGRLDMIPLTPAEFVCDDAINFFREKMARSPVPISVAKGYDRERHKNQLILTTPSLIPSLPVFPLPRSKVIQFLKKRGDDAYVLTVRSHRDVPSNELPPAAQIWLVAQDPEGVRNGLVTLLQLFWTGSDQFRSREVLLPECEIWDYPDLSFRGWHTVAPLSDQLPIYYKFCDVLSLLKFNYWILEINDRFPYRTHSDITHPRAPTRDQWQRLIGHAASRGVSIIPQIQSFGHFEYVLSKPRYRHLSELAQPDPRWGFYSYCPSNPETYRLLFDLMDEVIELFQPRWFHIGHDEITFVPMAVCPRCRGKNPDQLLTDDILRIHKYLKSRGVENVCLWCDQLEPSRTGGPPYGTYRAAESLPKDLIIFCWHYEPQRSYRFLTHHREKGFATVGCPWYHPENVWNLARESLDRRAVGLCGTTWYDLGGFENQIDLMASLIVGAENGWSVEIPPISRTAHPSPLIQDLLALNGNRPSWLPPNPTFFTLNLNRYTNYALFGSNGLIPQKVFSMETAGGITQFWAGIPFLPSVRQGAIGVLSARYDPAADLPNCIVVPIESRARAIYLVLSTDRRAVQTESLYQRGSSDPRECAILAVKYRDGSVFSQRLIYRRHLTEWSDRLGCSYSRLVHQTVSSAGQLVSFCAFRWDNPYSSEIIDWLIIAPLPVGLSVGLLAVTVVQ